MNQSNEHLKDVFEAVFNESMKLTESTEPANLIKLNAQMKSDSELNDLLNTPAKDLPEQYKYLVDEIYEDDKDKTLYYVIKESCNRLRSTSFFSMAGEKIVGFFAYIIGEGNKVDEIKMFSFDLKKPNPVLAGDLLRLIEKLRKTYVEISWMAIKENPANKQYEQAIKLYNGTIEEVSEKYYRYNIKGKNN